MLATAHAAADRRQPGGDPRTTSRRATRRSRSSSSPTGPARGVRGRIAAAWQAVVAGYYLATSRVFIVDDYFFPIYVIRPRAGTTIIQTWHACGAFKKVGYSVLDKSFGVDEALDQRVRIHSNYDVCLVASQAAAPHYAEAFRQPLERFRSRPRHPADGRALRRGAARPDARRGPRALRPARRPPGDPVRADVPRRQRHRRARHRRPRPRASLAAALGDDHVLLVRLHPFVRSPTPIGPDLADFAIDVSDHPDINELMLVSDVLVTDYSSAIYEFSLLGRPMVFFAPDYEAYERERGFYFDYRTGVPGPIFETTEALAAYLRAGDFDLERVGALPRRLVRRRRWRFRNTRHGRAHPAVIDPGGRSTIGLRTRLSEARCTIPRPSIPGVSRPCDRNRPHTMTFRAKPVVKRDHRPAWEAQDRRNFYLNLGLRPDRRPRRSSSSASRPGLNYYNDHLASVGSVDGQSITKDELRDRVAGRQLAARRGRPADLHRGPGRSPDRGPGPGPAADRSPSSATSSPSDLARAAHRRQAPGQARRRGRRQRRARGRSTRG